MSEPHNAKIRIVRVALEPSQWKREVLEIEALRPLIDVLPPEVLSGDAHWSIIDGGKVIPRDQWRDYIVRPNSELIASPQIMNGGGGLWKVAFGGLTAALGFATGNPMIGMMGLMMAGQGLNGLVTPRPKKRHNVEDSPQSYGFGPITNTTEPGSPIPVVYGRFVVGGLVAAREIRVGGQQVTHSPNMPSIIDDPIDEYTYSGESMRQIMVLCEGPVESITPYRINGTQPSAYYFDHVIAKGHDVQDPLEVMDGETKNSYIVGVAVPEYTAPYFYTTQASDVTGLEIQYDFPGGLYRINREDGTRNVHTIGIHITIAGETLLQAINVDVMFQARNNGAIRRAVKFLGLPRGTYEINTYRLAYTQDDSIVDQVTIRAVTEVTHEVFSYPGCAVAGIKNFPPMQIGNYAPPVVSYLVDGRKIRVFSTDTAYSIVWTDNPAWIALDVLTNERFGAGNHVWEPVSRQGSVALSASDIVIGSGNEDWTKRVRPGMQFEVLIFTGNEHTSGYVFTVKEVLSSNQIRLTSAWEGGLLENVPYVIREGDIDIPSFRGFSSRCSEPVPDGTGTGSMRSRATFNGVLAGGGSAWSTANKIVSVGLGQLIRLGHVISVVWQAPANPVQMFSAANIIEDSFKFTLPDMKTRPNVFEVAYVDKELEYTPESFIYLDPAITNNQDSERRLQVEAPGVTNRSLAAYLARYWFLVNKNPGALIEFEVGLDAIRCLPNDVISFAFGALTDGWEGRCVAGGDNDTIVLDQPVTLNSGTEYKIVVRHNGYVSGGIYVGGDVIETRIIGGATVFDEPTTELYVTAGFGYVPKQGDIYALGPSLTGPVRDYRIVDISRSQRFTAKITAIEYDPDLFNDTEILVDQPVLSLDYRPTYGVPGHVTNLRVHNLDLPDPYITWLAGTSGGAFATTNLYFFDSSGALIHQERGISAANGKFFLPYYLRRVGETYTVRAVAMSTFGIEARRDDAPSIVYTVTQDDAPPKPTGLELIEAGVGLGNTFEYSGTEPEFQWRYRGANRGFGLRDLWRESLGETSDGIDLSFRDFIIRVFDDQGVLRRTEYQFSNRWQYTTSKRTSDGVGTTFTLRVNGRDTRGIPSMVAASITVSPAT